MFRSLVCVVLQLFGASVCLAQSNEWLLCATAVKQKIGAGDYASAIREIERCRDTFKPMPTNAYWVFLNNAGIAYAESGQNEKAIEFKKEALSVVTARYLQKDTDVVDSQLGLAIAYMYAERTSEALPLLVKADSTSKRPSFSDPKLALRVTRTLASAYDKLGDVDKAIPIAREALASAEAQRVDAQELALFQTELALMLRKTARVDSAMPLFQAAYQARKTAAPKGNYGVANAAHNLALAYLDTCDLQRAKMLFNEAYVWRLQNLGALHPATIRTADAIKLSNNGTCKKS